MSNVETKAPVRFWHSFAFVVACGLLLRVQQGYHGFPSTSDYTTIPLSWRSLGPHPNTADFIAQGIAMHSVLWVPILWMCDAFGSLAEGFWILTVLLSIATVGVFHSLLKSTEWRRGILPLFLVFAFQAPYLFRGIGAERLTVLFSSSFHVQWIALLCVVWAYAEAIAGRALVSGALLAIATIAQPIIGLHGLLATSLIAFCGPAGKLSRLLKFGCATAFVSLPVIASSLFGMFVSNHPSWAAKEISRQLLFRFPDEFDLRFDSPVTFVATVSLEVLLVLVGIYILWRARPGEKIRQLFAAWLVHLSLFVATIVVFGPWRIPRAEALYSRLYLVGLSMTTPIFFALSALIIAAAINEAFHNVRNKYSSARTLSRIYLVVSGGFFLYLVHWTSTAIILLGIYSLMLLARKFPAIRSLDTIGLLGIALISLYLISANDIRTIEVPDEQASLYEWIKQNTRSEDLFIIPPAFKEFRLHARRAVYVDFNLFPNRTDHILEWRERLERVSDPDRFVPVANGWQEILFWDRTYATRNSKKRIAELLQETAAEYFVFDRHGLRVPPFVAQKGESSDALKQVFDNGRYIVYACKDSEK